MVLNNKGQIGIVLGIMFFVLGLIVAVITYPVIKDVLTTAISGYNPETNTTGLDCDNTSISPSILATCLAVDLIPAAYFITVLAVGLGALALGSKYGGG